MSNRWCRSLPPFYCCTISLHGGLFSAPEFLPRPSAVASSRSMFADLPPPRAHFGALPARLLARGIVRCWRRAPRETSPGAALPFSAGRWAARSRCHWAASHRRDRAQLALVCPRRRRSSVPADGGAARDDRRDARPENFRRRAHRRVTSLTFCSLFLTCRVQRERSRDRGLRLAASCPAMSWFARRRSRRRADAPPGIARTLRAN